MLIGPTVVNYLLLLANHVKLLWNLTTLFDMSMICIFIMILVFWCTAFPYLAIPFLSLLWLGVTMTKDCLWLQEMKFILDGCPLPLAHCNCWVDSRFIIHWRDQIKWNLCLYLADYKISLECFLLKLSGWVTGLKYSKCKPWLSKVKTWITFWNQTTISLLGQVNEPNFQYINGKRAILSKK